MLTTPAQYRIRVQGQLGAQWADWFAGFTLSWEQPGETVLVGQIIDQAALHGLLNTIREPSPAAAGSSMPHGRDCEPRPLSRSGAVSCFYSIRRGCAMPLSHVPALLVGISR
jgi:hypothetical protein